MPDFTLLGRTDGEIAWGLAGRFWGPDGRLLRFADVAAFDAPLPPNCAKLVWSFAATPEGRGARLCTASRVHWPDRAAPAAFAPYWAVIRPFGSLVRRRLLGAVARRAEADGARPTRP